MLSIRFSRKGKKKYPIYRLIITEKQKDPFGDYLENLGTYNPHTKEVQLKVERIKYWLSQGAQATATVHNLLVGQKVIAAEKVRASKSKPGKKKKVQLELEKTEAAAQQAEAAKQAAAAASVANQATEEANKAAAQSTDQPIEEKKEQPKAE
ncbi:MAG TPA: 30S ribosomal protein S16 [bacterium]|nr:30S ribosomal protein S16 [bacterium]HNS34090.1 30S ribosomal protein S16 [bacterium]HNW09095.1 30S ribosomal protein S16 [bacterium]HNZ73593.1 30S ribosomal protein S16 [bacterium]HOH67207.1 30S ribosomal protein S16 [bacterium]